MSSERTPAVIVVGIVLTLTLGVGNAVFAAHATILDPGFVNDAIEGEDGYDALTTEMRGAIEDATNDAIEGGIGGQAFASLIEGDPIQSAVTKSYVQSQVEPNVRNLYAYLHGNSARLNLSVNTAPLAETAGQNVAATIEEESIPELVEAAPGDPLADVPVNSSFVRDLNAGPQSYQDAKQQLRDDIRERVLDEMVDRAFERSSNDELLALVIEDYDPTAHSEAEKERMVAEREPEIRSALRQRIERQRGDEIEAAIQDRLDQFRREAADVQPTAEEVGSPAIASAAGDLQSAVLTAATTDQSYQEYRANVTSARADLASAVGDHVVEQFRAEAGVVDLNQRLNIAERGAFGSVRSIVGILDMAAIVVPIIALLLLGGAYFLSKSVATTAATLGASMVVGSIPALVGAPMAGDRIRSAVDLEGDAARTLEPVVQGVVDRVVGSITGQSLLLAGLGVVLVGVALALRYGADDWFRDLVQEQ